ncbi:hypothetical protein [Spirochaeta africana]|uniref:Membrane protein (DUF2339) n=1 Tax=Spirochaeta africana (strain ATCC 700263 / DSM 8902 / Z-7692) TaxID=889378 RepID=H9ULZ7_SPIAZ|nr:hypothetical protein [Spirochaeta africana]AFG38540.1 hypothetical protein Spiaf_2510 [Spirochaeta africana DSM 8902]
METLITLFVPVAVLLFALVFMQIEKLKQEIAELRRQHSDVRQYRSLSPGESAVSPTASPEPAKAADVDTESYNTTNSIDESGVPDVPLDHVPHTADTASAGPHAGNTPTGEPGTRQSSGHAGTTGELPTPAPLWQRLKPMVQMLLRGFWNHGLAVIGVVLLVAGVSFFGVWAATRLQPAVRFGLLVAAAGGLAGASLLVRQNTAIAAEWLRSAAAAVYLFATLGAGGISGLQFIYNPLGGLLLLASGIMVNLAIVLLHRATIFAALHIALSLIALSVAPQNVIILFAAAITVWAGLSIPVRRRADREHLVAILLFMGFMVSWALRAETHLAFYNLSALGIILLTGGLNIYIHYRQLYRSSRFELLPLIAHLANWGFLVIGILWFAPTLRLAAIPLFVGGLLLLVLAQHAARLGIDWLHSCDSLVALMLLALAAVSLVLLELPLHLVLWIVFAEAAIAARLVPRLGSALLDSVAAFFLPAAGLALLWFQLQYFDHFGGSSPLIETRVFTMLLCAAGLVTGLLLLQEQSARKTLGRKIGWMSGAVVAGLLLAGGSSLAVQYFGAGWGIQPAIAAVPGFYILLRARQRHTGLVAHGIAAGIFSYAVIASSAVMISLFAGERLHPLTFLILILQQPLLPAVLLGYAPPHRRNSSNPGVIWLMLTLSILLPYQLSLFAGVPTYTSPLAESAGIVWALMFALSIFGASSDRLQTDRIPELRTSLLRWAWLPLGLFGGFYILIASSSSMTIAGRPELLPAQIWRHIPLRWVTALMGLGAVVLAYTRRRSLPRQGWPDRVVAWLPEIGLGFLALVLLQEGSITSRPVLFSAAALLLIWPATRADWKLSRLSWSVAAGSGISSLLIIAAAPEVTFSATAPSAGAVLLLLALLLQFGVVVGSRWLHGPGWQHYLFTAPVFLGMAALVARSFPPSLHTLLIGVIALLLFTAGLHLQQAIYRHLSSALILIVLLRLVFIELAQAAMLDRAIAFVGMALILLLMNWIHKTAAARQEPRE